jgi:RimJ/RimL family protein N-acetyltransferase
MMRRLSDGAPLVVRPIRSDDKKLLSRALHQLSDTSVQRRFLTPKRHLSSSELRYLTEVDGRNHVALVVESPTQPVRHFVGVGRFVRLSEDPSAAEVAIVVADQWQRRGVGSLLARELAVRARGLGIRRFTATMAANNTAAHKLMRKLTRRLEEHRSGAVDEASIDLAA